MRTGTISNRATHSHWSRRLRSTSSIREASSQCQNGGRCWAGAYAGATRFNRYAQTTAQRRLNRFLPRSLEANAGSAAALTADWTFTWLAGAHSHLESKGHASLKITVAQSDLTAYARTSPSKLTGLKNRASRCERRMRALALAHLPLKNPFSRYEEKRWRVERPRRSSARLGGRREIRHHTATAINRYRQPVRCDRTGTVLLSPFLRPGSVSNDYFNHYSLLRTVEEIFDLEYLNYAGHTGQMGFFGCVASDIVDTTKGQFSRCQSSR